MYDFKVSINSNQVNDETSNYIPHKPNSDCILQLQE